MRTGASLVLLPVGPQCTTCVRHTDSPSRSSGGWEYGVTELEETPPSGGWECGVTVLKETPPSGGWECGVMVPAGP